MAIDYSKYPPDWKQIVKRIRKRAGEKCEVCGLKNKQSVTAMTLWVRNNKGKYQLKSFWVSNESDIIRMEPARHGRKEVRVVLTVAHLDHDETNWDVKDDRLKAMCQYCHLNYDAVEKMRRICLGKPNSGRPLDPICIDTLVALKENGLSVRGIAEQMGVHRCKVERELKRFFESLGGEK